MDGSRSIIREDLDFAGVLGRRIFMPGSCCAACASATPEDRRSRGGSPPPQRQMSAGLVSGVS
ncbi:hypothetical protein BE21_54850 [Sorangium cellulosum]|uniref:Uncharacterized protein n=1 Tax=Sorangium cellulosum TaxID=56 RepID=A0A150TCV0_SORCE|nr:hypothetical protein BE21_54850 [Sorangium cellulosum]